MNWKTGAVLLTLLAVTGCGNVANNAANATGNAAGFVGETPPATWFAVQEISSVKEPTPSAMQPVKLATQWVVLHEVA